jgi:hypothetical protein
MLAPRKCVCAAARRTIAFSNSSSLRVASLRIAMGSRAQQKTSETTCGVGTSVQRQCLRVCCDARVRWPAVRAAARVRPARREGAPRVARPCVARRRRQRRARRATVRVAATRAGQERRAAARLRALHANRLLQHERGRRALAQLLREREPRLRRRAQRQRRGRSARGASGLVRASLCCSAASSTHTPSHSKMAPIQPVPSRSSRSCGARRRVSGARRQAETLCNFERSEACARTSGLWMDGSSATPAGGGGSGLSVTARLRQSYALPPPRSPAGTSAGSATTAPPSFSGAAEVLNARAGGPARRDTRRAARANDAGQARQAAGASAGAAAAARRADARVVAPTTPTTPPPLNTPA